MKKIYTTVETLVSQYQQQIAGFQEHAQSKDASLSNLQQQIAGFQDHAQSKDANLSNLRQTYSAYQTEATGTITRLQRDLEDARNRAPQVVTQTRVVTQKIPVLVRPTIRPYKLRHGQSVYPRGGRGNFALSSGNGYDVSAVGAGRASQWARQQVRQQVRQRSGRRVHRVGSFHRRSIK